VESSAAGSGTKVPPGSETGAVLGDQAEFPCPGDSLGAVGCAELAEDVADVLFGRVEGDDEFPGDRPGRSDRHAGGCQETLDPCRQIVSQDNPNGVSRIGGRAGTQRLPTLRPHHRETGEAGPEAQSTVSLPNRRRSSLLLRKRFPKTYMPDLRSTRLARVGPCTRCGRSRSSGSRPA
jgi:hypothetical protein